MTVRNIPSLQSVVNVGNVLSNNSKIIYGTTNQGSTYFDGIDFVIAPRESGSTANLLIGPTANQNIRFMNCAGGGAVITNNRMFSGDFTGSTFTNVFNATLNYTGSSASIRALGFTVNAQNASGTPSPSSFCISNLDCDNTGSPGVTGFIGQASITSTRTVTGFTNVTLTGLSGAVATNANSHSCNLIIKSIRAQDPGAYTTSGTNNAWALLCEGDSGIVTDKKWYWENSTTVKGDSYYVFNSATTDLDHFIDNVKVMTEDNDAIDHWVPSTVIAGTSTTQAKMGGTIFDHFADVGNVGTGEDDLYSDTLAASVLAADGDKITATYAGIFVGAAASTQELRAYFGGTKIYDSGALAIGAITSNWTMMVTIIRESSSVVRCTVSLSTDFATLFPYSTYTRITGLTLSNTQIIKITGEAAGVGAVNNQIVAKLGYGEFKKGT